MNAIVKSPFAWLLKREYWEERRSFLRAQVVVAGVLVVLTILAIIVAEAARIHAGIGFNEFSKSSVTINGVTTSTTRALNDAISQNPEGVVKGLNIAMLSFQFFSGVVLFFVVFFYLLGALYDDRRDRSILFWKSLPVSDTATVISKVVAAILVAPVIAAVAVLAGYIAQQIVMSIWFAVHGLNPFMLIWAHADPLSTWLHILAGIPVDAVWALPTVGWLLFCSAAARSKPFLWAVFIPIILGVLNVWVSLLGLPHVNLEFFWTDLVGRGLLSVFPGSWVFAHPDAVGALANAGSNGLNLDVITYGMMYRTFALPQMWIGAIVGIALIAAAIWFRRWRDEV